MSIRKINTEIWDDPRVIELSCAGKLAYMYLLSTPRGNLSGCFECTVACLTRDTGLALDEARGALGELTECGLVRADEQTPQEGPSEDEV